MKVCKYIHYSYQKHTSTPANLDRAHAGVTSTKYALGRIENYQIKFQSGPNKTPCIRHTCRLMLTNLHSTSTDIPGLRLKDEPTPHIFL